MLNEADLQTLWKDLDSLEKDLIDEGEKLSLVAKSLFQLKEKLDSDAKK
jgi:hypothetical protein